MIGFGQAVNLTGSNALFTGSGRLLGFYVNSTSSGTIVLKDRNGGTDGGRTLTGTITPAVGWHFFPLEASAGLYAKLGGTINVTFLVIPA